MCCARSRHSPSSRILDASRGNFDRELALALTSPQRSVSAQLMRQCNAQHTSQTMAKRLLSVEVPRLLTPPGLHRWRWRGKQREIWCESTACLCAARLASEFRGGWTGLRMVLKNWLAPPTWVYNDIQSTNITSECVRFGPDDFWNAASRPQSKGDSPHQLVDASLHWRAGGAPGHGVSPYIAGGTRSLPSPTVSSCAAPTPRQPRLMYKHKGNKHTT